ncbi:hypothetical protein Terro_3096 [Terriglobus roseus DSM 18391]|uniref:PRTase-CE domain-containing protein n=1 Tax=Terriglobus roseus (strain DSM 18391 / NRRL B-41598 / KBS 63) TaxID=926566 RepID=I3ZJA9_TERRK|nr:hypothetical protein [Terriglobus roseus]AFL89327.1 hypothetical protein Terro_3096 [Terriglobus roseus DSM 18391]
MNQDLGLRVLSQILGWDDDRAREEFSRLSILARYKYDSYRDFVAGARFIEKLAEWLQQFALEDRAAAYQFVHANLIYLTPSEINHLVELCFPERFQPALRAAAAIDLGIKPYAVWADSQSARAYARLLRSSLFIGLSDGARIDAFRRANAGVISNEQVLLALEISDEKWQQVLKDLRDDLDDPEAKFQMVFLIDDFAGTGSTLIRFDKDQWKGRLEKLWKNIKDKLDTHFTSEWRLHIHHYLATEQAQRHMLQSEQKRRSSEDGNSWLPAINFSFGTILGDDLSISPSTHAEFWRLMQNHYNSSIQTKHTDVGGAENIANGYGGCGLPLVLEHNTPNNSVALLWAECDATDKESPAPAMRPLFRRRQRHS